jgi:hypothetical protein
MKKILTIAAVVALGTVASYSQGLVSISLTGGSLVSTNTIASVNGKANGGGNYLYELLISPNLTLSGTDNQIQIPADLAVWTDSGVSGTTGAALTAGKITAVGSASATGWAAPGVSYDDPMSYIIVGWSSNLGLTWGAVANLITTTGLTPSVNTYFGTTAVALNFAGGGSVPLPAINLWSNSTGTPGYGAPGALVLQEIVPEPTTMALVGLGGLSLLLFRRRK